MTARDTHETRLEQWPRLSTFPTGTAVIASAIILDFLTFVVWAGLSFIFLMRSDSAAEAVAVCRAAGEAIPQGWLLFLAGLHGIATTHFGIKRKTDFRARMPKSKPKDVE